MSGSTAGERHYFSRQLPVREEERECGTGSPEKTFDLVPVPRTVSPDCQLWMSLLLAN